MKNKKEKRNKAQPARAIALAAAFVMTLLVLSGYQQADKDKAALSLLWRQTELNYRLERLTQAYIGMVWLIDNDKENLGEYAEMLEKTNELLKGMDKEAAKLREEGRRVFGVSVGAESADEWNLEVMPLK